MKLEEFKAQAKKDLSIDDYNLQKEWTRQANLYVEYSTKMSSLIKKQDTYRADLANKISATPSKYGLEKGAKGISETAIKRVIDNDKGHIDLDFQVALHSNVVKAMEHKKKALEWKCQLLLGGFYADPKQKALAKKEI